MHPSLLVVAFVLAAGPELAPPPRAVVPPKKDAPTIPAELTPFRAIGPALTSGRVVGFAVDPKDKAKYFVAVASGGVWKTLNNGTTWTPVFDRESSYSVGVVVLDPKNSDIVWVGTGENNSQRSVGYGDGVYKSTDGGKSWTNVGLKTSEHIGKILIHPTDSNTVYVAAQGPLWGSGGARGLYKTTDGGTTWTRVLAIDENTGVTDVVMPDPKVPEVLVAASYQRRRHVWSIINGGPGSAVHRSLDGGKTWKKVAGLPGVDLGRIGLAAAPNGPNTVYATVEAAEKQGGIFRSTDGGANWEKRNSFDAQAQYYSHPVVDPANKDRLYVMNVFIQVSDDGGATLHSLGGGNAHVDNHEIWIDPTDAKHYLVGCDGGIYESFDRAGTWQFKSNLPITQFYDIGVDQNPASGKFYHVYGGTQDNYTLGGPVRRRSNNGITNGDWYVVQGGDGFHCKVDPSDPDTVYGESQYGGLCRFDRRTGTRVDIQPRAGLGKPPLRWNWDSPLIVSPHNPKRIYFAANVLFQSDDRGDSWTAASPDLSRQLDRDKLPLMGKVWGPDAVFRHGSTSFYGNIVALAESQKKEGLLYVGTDDGLVQVKDDAGPGWRKVEKFPGVPDRVYVSKLVTSQHDANTAFASFDNHKNSDFKPYLLKSTDAGRTWASIAGDLPERGSVYCLAEDHLDPNLLFVGTEFGAFATYDGGKIWHKLKGLPTIQVKDLVIQKHNDDLVVGTFGRGIYVLDDYSALRAYTPAVAAKPTHLFVPKDTLLYAQSSQYGGGGKSFQGASFYTADNPTFGATFLIHLKDVPKTLKQKRLDKEKSDIEAKKPKEYPSVEQLRKEADEEAPALSLTIADAEGNVVRTLPLPATVGWHRATWGLQDAALGLFVVPGKYTASVGQRVGGKLAAIVPPTAFAVSPDPVANLTNAQYQEIAAFHRQAKALLRTQSGTNRYAGELATRLDQYKSALDQLTKPDEPAQQTIRELIGKVKLVQRVLNGDGFLAGRGENVPESIADHMSHALHATGGTIAVPTGSQKTALTEVGNALGAEIAKLRTIVEKDLPVLDKIIEANGGPAIPGKLPTGPGK